MKKVRTRIAPSPTGPMHCGNIRTALFNYLLAKRYGGDFILRIEDTDTKREVSGAKEYLIDSLKWLGITPNEGYGIGGDHGPYIQSERKDIYKKYINTLIESGHAYYAFDTADELSTMRDNLKAAGAINTGYMGVVRDRMKNSISLSAEVVKNKLDAGEPYVVRFKIPRAKEVKFKDEVRGWVTFNTKDLDDKVIWKSSDEMPTFHGASVIDDHLMEISHVIRGEEWVSSTALHVLLYEAFGWEKPVFAHLPLILGPDGKKLGKRNKYGIPVFMIDWTYTDSEGEIHDIKGFREAGYEPDALVNFLSLLGWNPGDDIEHMTMKEMCDSFSLERVNKGGAMFDMKKLNSFNSHYLNNREIVWIIDKINLPKDFTKDMDSEKLCLIAKSAAERAIFAHDLKNKMEYLWNSPTLEGEFKMKNVDEFISVMSVFMSDDFSEDWTSENIKLKLESISDSLELSVGKVMPMLRVALTGGKPGPQLPEVMYIIGLEESKSRISALLNKIKELA